ncbi:hypothetical protein J3E73DRAFT_398359 [Bipolaris maydis]|nr:hypothetical protein J3E73DRAFT_398359 [Bipolaris maydis]
MRAPNLSVAVALLAIAVVTGPRLVIYMVGGRERDTVRLAVTRPVLHLHLGRFFGRQDPARSVPLFFSEQYSQHRLCNPRYPE